MPIAATASLPEHFASGFARTGASHFEFFPGPMKSTPVSSIRFAMRLKPICFIGFTRLYFIGFTQPGFISIRRHPE
jgi:hypothetical protein